MANISPLKSSRAVKTSMPRNLPAVVSGLQLPADLSFDEWKALGFDLARRASLMMWEIGDWWAYGQAAYGDRSAVVETEEWEGPAFNTCVNAGTVARAFESPRRRGLLSYSHHNEVAPLPPNIADELLNLAEAERWSVRRLREEKAKAITLQSWSPSERARRREVEQGNTVVASMRQGQDGRRVDENLLSWAEAKDIAIRIDRATEWGNPFEMPDDGDRDTVIANYGEHYFPYKPSLHEKLPNLRGKVVICWCHPEPCHGDFICQEVNGSEEW